MTQRQNTSTPETTPVADTPAEIRDEPGTEAPRTGHGLCWLFGILGPIIAVLITVLVMWIFGGKPDCSETEAALKAAKAEIAAAVKAKEEAEAALEAAKKEDEDDDKDTYRTLDLVSARMARETAKSYERALRQFITAAQSDPEYVSLIEDGINAIPVGQTGRLNKEVTDVVKEAREAFDLIVEMKVEQYQKYYDLWDYPSPQELGYPTPAQFRAALKNGDRIELPPSGTSTASTSCSGKKLVFVH